MRKSIRFLVLCFAVPLFSITSEYNYAPDFDKVDYERPIVVCIPSFNNEKYCYACLESVFIQNYKNFRVIYIDDASTDKTNKYVYDYINKKNVSDRISMITNPRNQTMLPNHYFMAHLCEDEEIVVSLDGDDKFFNNDALSRINRAYMDEDVWVTYGQFQETGNKYYHKPRAVLKHKLHPRIVRKMPFMFMQPRTYYAGLFKQIPQEYFEWGTSLYPISGDVAIMTFLIDLAREHTYFIPDIIYSYNNENPINDHNKDRDFQLEVEKAIKLRAPLERATKPY
jgi:glycosyltransferase involved in cell wall biosynthesis